MITLADCFLYLLLGPVFFFVFCCLHSENFENLISSLEYRNYNSVEESKMPSRNSVNKPKLTSNIQHKNQSLARKRADRERKGLFQPARSSDDSKSGQVKSVALDLYFKGAPQGTVTSKTLSKKRQQKIERNLKYAERRKLLTDVQAKLEDDMEVEPEIDHKSTTVKDALWSAIEDTQSSSNLFQEGQGTTLGGPFFP